MVKKNLNKGLFTRSSPIFLDSVFELESSEPLMIKHFTNFASVEAEVRMWEVHKRYNSNEYE